MNEWMENGKSLQWISIHSDKEMNTDTGHIMEELVM